MLIKHLRNGNQEWESLNQIPRVSPNLQIAIYLKDWSSLPYLLFQ